MYYDLIKINNLMDISKYSLKDLALYFEKYDGYVCKIVTNSKEIKFKIEVSSLPHLIGLQHAFKGTKNKNEYKGFSGFEKMKNGLTYKDIMKSIKHTKSNVTWANIKNRIKYLPVFLNNIDKGSKLKIRNDELMLRSTYIRGDYFLYKNLFNNYPTFSLKNIGGERTILETFVVETNISLLGALYEEKIKSIELISPLDVTSPVIIKKEKVEL